MFSLPLPSPSPSSNLVPRRQKREKERVHVTICFDWFKNVAFDIFSQSKE